MKSKPLIINASGIFLIIFSIFLSFNAVLVSVLGRFGSYWVVLDRFGSFWVVPSFRLYRRRDNFYYGMLYSGCPLKMGVVVGAIHKGRPPKLPILLRLPCPHNCRASIGKVLIFRPPPPLHVDVLYVWPRSKNGSYLRETLGGGIN